MIIHYIWISLRNLRKYKAQTVISICAMAVSLTLMAVVSSFLLSIKETPLLSKPYADRTVMLSLGNDARYKPAGPELISLITSHQFKSVEEIHYYEYSEGNPMTVTANPNGDNETTDLNESFLVDSGFLKFQGMKSACSGKEIGIIAKGEAVITEKLARKLFGKENPIGKSVYVNHYHSDNKPLDNTYTVKDVMENPSPKQAFFRLPEGLFICSDEVLTRRDTECFFVLKSGASTTGFEEELNELFGENNKIYLIDVKKHYSIKSVITVRNAIIIFLFMFVLVAFSNYLRQQIQLFRLREREVALRTCIGCMPSSMFLLFSTEVLIVLLVTLALSLILVLFVSGLLSTSYSNLFVDENYSLAEAVPIVLAANAGLIAIGLVAVALTVRRIRHGQTGLALRMKPLPKHRLRNAGLTLQMTVSIVFIFTTMLYFMSVKSIRESYGIPDDPDKYKKYLNLRITGVDKEKENEIFNRIEHLQSVEKVYKFISSFRRIVFDDRQDDWERLSLYFQHDMDAVDFYGLKYEDIGGKVNPDKFVLISSAFRQILTDKGLWNGRTVDVPDYGEYDVKGVFDNVPFEDSDSRNSIVVYDVSDPFAFGYDRVIEPKAGMSKEAYKEVEDVIKEVLPNRIDITIRNFYKSNAPAYEGIIALITVIYIMSAISIVTTIAAIYAGVSLDTRRRRKEMALRKLNGAGRKVIAMIFLRTYIWIVAVATLMAGPLCFMVADSILKTVFEGIDLRNTIPAYIVSVLLITAVTALTIAWKIRDIMAADPIEYLKE